jgi:hypothetical protein
VVPPDESGEISRKVFLSPFGTGLKVAMPRSYRHKEVDLEDNRPLVQLWLEPVDPRARLHQTSVGWSSPDVPTESSKYTP